LSQIIRYQINGLILAVRHNRGGPIPVHTQTPTQHSWEI
jgi:hypothetical protein